MNRRTELVTLNLGAQFETELNEQLFCAAGLEMSVEHPCYRTFLANYVNIHKGC